MPFDTFTARLQHVAAHALAHCRKQYGNNYVRTEVEIAPAISWRPTFFLKPTNSLIIAVEVADNVYPEAFKGAAYDIGLFDFPIAVFQACSLDVFQADPNHTRVKLLRDHGFGIITVADNGSVIIQNSAIPLAQHISPQLLDSELAGLNPSLRPRFRAAYTTYIANEGQGLQQAGQIVEALVVCLTKHAVKNNLLAPGILGRSLADMIDGLYACQSFAPHRAALGGTRDFVREFRNTASHAPRSGRQAAEKIRNCRTGFMDAMAVARKLRGVMQANGCTVKVYTT